MHFLFSLIKKSSKNAKITISGILELAAGMTSIVSALLLFLYLSDQVLEKETIFFDTSIIHFIYSFRTPFMNAIMLAFSFLGSGTFLALAVLGTIIFLWQKHHKKDAMIFSFLLIFGALLNTLLKNIFERTRPNLFPLVNEPSYSFPSGHSMNSFIFYTALSYFVLQRINNRTLRFITIFLSGVLVLAIGISRIYLGAHYPSDVLAGYLAGFLWFLCVILFEKTLTFLRIYKERKHK